MFLLGNVLSLTGDTEAASQRPAGMNKNPVAHKLYSVRRIIDGQTIELADGTVVRLLGIDADWDDSPRFKAKATELLENLIIGWNKVVLDYDEASSVTNYRDNRNRVLAFVCGGEVNRIKQVLDSPTRRFTDPSIVETWGFLDLDTGRRFWKSKAKMLTVFWNATLIKAGYAQADRHQPHRFREQFLTFEAEAKAANRGLWHDPSPK